ncbi:MAG TPA: hypothetical protein EYQ03_08395 [Nitrospinaceae bacterium]|nr:hypothetical protein [Nitrospinaceae bacterium]
MQLLCHKKFVVFLNFLFQFVRDGEPAKRMFSIPVYQRSDDGTVFTPGHVVNLGQKFFVVRDICISSDLLKVNAILVDASSDNVHDEVVVIGIDEITPVVSKREMSGDLSATARNMVFNIRRGGKANLVTPRAKSLRFCKV